MNDKELVATIKKIVKDAGYPFWDAYNDKHRDGGRRLKMMINGHDYGPKKYRAWEQKIVEGMKKARIKRRIQSCGFETCESWRGPYQAYIVYIKPSKESK